MSTGASFYDSEGQVRETELHDQQAADAELNQSATPTSPDPLKQTANQAASQAQQMASNVADQAQQVAQSQVATQKDRAVNSLSAVGQAVTQVGQQLRQNNQGPIAQVADTAAANINQMADYLRQRDVRGLLNDVENMARRQPVLFLGGAFLLGVLGARFLKSTGSAIGGTSSGNQPGGYQYSRYGAGYGSSYGSSYGSGYGSGSGVRTGQGYNRMPSPGPMTGGTSTRGDGGTFAGEDAPDAGSTYRQNPAPSSQTSH